MRLQKYLANAGVCSRREAENYIQDGFVKINDKPVTKLGTKIDPEKDQIKFKNKLIKLEEEKIYLLLNKPKGFVSTCKDTHDRKTILDLLPDDKRLFPIGRLDQDTEGLLIVTNDGELTYKLTHPKHKIEKEYYTVCRGELTEEEKKKLERGIVIDGKKTARSAIKIEKFENNKTRLNITIHEGRKRQIRNMFEIIGHKVHYLQRIRIGHIHIGKLKKGSYRVLKRKEIEAFFNH